MNLLAWLTGTWKAGTWADGAWQSAGGTVPPTPGGGGFLPLPLREPKRRPKEDDDAFLIAVLL
jgi:hypothetical protein